MVSNLLFIFFRTTRLLVFLYQVFGLDTFEISWSSINDVNNISEDLRDRCGSFTNEVQNLIDDSKILVMIKNTGVINIKSNSSRTSLLLSANINKSVFENILTLVTNKPNIYSINKENKFIIELNEDNSSLRRKTVIKLLNEII